MSEVALQDGERADRSIGDAPERKRDERDDDQGIEDDRAQDGALGLAES